MTCQLPKFRRRGESLYERILQQHNLLKILEARDAKTSKIAPNWNVNWNVGPISRPHIFYAAFRFINRSSSLPGIRQHSYFRFRRFTIGSFHPFSSPRRISLKIVSGEKQRMNAASLTECIFSKVMSISTPAPLPLREALRSVVRPSLGASGLLSPTFAGRGCRIIQRIIEYRLLLVNDTAKKSPRSPETPLITGVYGCAAPSPLHDGQSKLSSSSLDSSSTLTGYRFRLPVASACPSGFTIVQDGAAKAKESRNPTTLRPSLI